MLLDLHLPGRDGVAMLRELERRRDRTPVPVLVLTASAATEDVRRCDEADANSYVTKPTDLGGYLAVMGAIATFWLRAATPPTRRA